MVSSVYTGVAQGAQPILSRFYGQGDRESVRRILRYGVRTVLLLSGCVYLTFFAAAGPIAGAFNSGRDMRLQQIAVHGLRVYFTAVFFAGFNIMISTYFASTEKSLPAQAVSLSRGLVLIIPMAFFLSSLFGMTGVWLSYPITEGIVALAGILFRKRLFPKKV